MMLIPIVIVFVIAICFIPVDAINISVDKSTYSSGDSIVFSGSIDQINDGQFVSVQILNPSKSDLVQVDTFSLNSDGIFSRTYKAEGAKWGDSGIYTLHLFYNGEKYEITFEFMFVPESTTESETKRMSEHESEENSDQQLTEPKELEIPAPFVDVYKDPQSYVDRYNTEESYKEWFDENYPEYESIYQAVGLEKPKPIEEPIPKIGECGPGTELRDGICELTEPTEREKGGGGCLIATAAYGSEMAPQVQFLREVRDGKVMSTEHGASFMAGFNEFYYSFSPYIADYERENPVFREMVRVGITPMLYTLSVMSMADSEQEVLAYGIGVILMNVGMYVAAPAMLIYGINKVRKVKF